MKRFHDHVRIVSIRMCRMRLSIVLLALLLGGCNKEPMGGPRLETVPVTGRVLVDGQPEKGVAVMFLRVAPKRVDFPVPDPEGVTDDDGVLTVGTYYKDDGGIPGEYRLIFSRGQLNPLNGDNAGDTFQGKYIDRENSEFTVIIPEDVGEEPFDIGTIELSSAPPAAAEPESATSTSPADAPEQPPDGAVPLNPQKTVHLDAARKRILLKTQVVLREGVLEMFACLAGTKEHESIVAVDTDAYVIHAGLLAIGAEPGAPVQFEPQYRPPQGQRIDIFVNWTDADGRPHRRPAQHWVRHVTRRYYLEPLEALPDDLTLPEDGELRYDEKRKQLIWFGPMSEQQRDELLSLSEDAAYQRNVRTFFTDSRPREMEADFVFAGSGFWEEQDGAKYYLAESGNVICVANFSDAIIDVAVKSLSSNDELLFEPYTERIPPVGSEVTVELIPHTEREAPPAETD